MLTGDDPFAAMSLPDLEAQRGRLEDELERLERQDPAVTEARRRLDAVTREITRAGQNCA